MPFLEQVLCFRLKVRNETSREIKGENVWNESRMPGEDVNRKRQIVLSKECKIKVNVRYTTGIAD